MDLRVRISEARRSGESTAEVAERFGVGAAFVRRPIQRHRDTGSLAPKAGPRGPKPKLAADRDIIRACNAEHPDRASAEVFAALGPTFK